MASDTPFDSAALSGVPQYRLFSRGDSAGRVTIANFLRRLVFSQQPSYLTTYYILTYCLGDCRWVTIESMLPVAS